MATIALLSACGGPGVTTTALAMTMTWPRSAVLIEADPSHVSSVLPGFLKGRFTGERSIINLAVTASQRGRFDVNDLWGQLRPLDDETGEQANRWVLPGILAPQQARSITGLWPDMATSLDALGAAGTDTLIDLGRWNLDDKRAPLLHASDLVIVLTRPTLPDAFAVRARVEEIRSLLARTGREERLVLVSVETEKTPYTGQDVAKSVGVNLLGNIAYDRGAAAVFSDGIGQIDTGRRSRPYVRNIEGISRTAITLMRSQRRFVDEGQEEAHHE